MSQGINSNTSLVTAAFLAGCTEALLTPFERIQTLMLDQVAMIIHFEMKVLIVVLQQIFQKYFTIFGNDDTLN